MSHTLSAPVTAELISLLKDESAALRAFIVVLEKEQQALLDLDIEPLLPLAETKTQSAYKLADLANTRRKLLNPNPAKLDTSAWIQQYAPSCHAAWEEIRELAARAHQLNHINGEVIQLKLRSNQQTLTALLGAAQNATGLYGRDGQPSLPASGRTLGSG